MIMAVAIVGIITPMVLSLLMTVLKGFTGYEAAVQLRKNNQASINRIYLRLGSCKRMFENETVAANNYLTRISLTGYPTLLAGSKLPTISETGVLNIDSPTFVSANVGNSMFFVSNDSSSVLSDTGTVRIDLFRFNYYYLTSDNPHPLYDRESYLLVEWRSIQYADYNGLVRITTAAVQQSAVKELVASGINYAWDSSAVATNAAFYNLTTGGAMVSVPAYTIENYKCTTLTSLLTGIVMGGYKYGISANSAGWAKAPKTVPKFATANVKFPGGFETAVVGHSSGRQVLMRTVLVAQGNMPSIIGDDILLITSVRDLW
jgi:hypothetical protein